MASQTMARQQQSCKTRSSCSSSSLVRPAVGCRGRNSVRPFQGAAAVSILSPPSFGPQLHMDLQRSAGVIARAMRADAQTEQLDATTLRLIADVTKQVDDLVAATVFANNEAAKRADFSPTGELRTKVQAGLRKLSKGLLERDTEVRAFLHHTVPKGGSCNRSKCWGLQHTPRGGSTPCRCG